MANFFDKANSEKVGNMLAVLILVVGLFFGMKFINQVKEFSVIGMNPRDVATIDVVGNGEKTAVPNLATINFTVELKDKTVELAQAAVAKRINPALDFLKSSGIADGDINTANYNSYPEYNNPCNGGYPCVNSTPKIVDYITSENVSVKIHDVSMVGKIIDGLGSAGITGISAPDFALDNSDSVKADARALAITDAKSKADILAKQLGVKLGRIIRFTDGSNPVVMPMMAKAEVSMAGVVADSNLPVGENKYTSSVVITYEIIQ